MEILCNPIGRIHGFEITFLHSIARLVIDDVVGPVLSLLEEEEVLRARLVLPAVIDVENGAVLHQTARLFNQESITMVLALEYIQNGESVIGEGGRIFSLADNASGLCGQMPGLDDQVSACNQAAGCSVDIPPLGYCLKFCRFLDREMPSDQGSSKTRG